MIRRFNLILAAPLLLGILASGCTGGADDARITADESEPYDGIAADETFRFLGNEPFWGGEVTGGSLLYTTPEDIEGETIAVKRFAGMNGLGYSGTMDGAGFDMAITPGECSDTMSDRTYPFTVTLRLGDEQRNGCGWTDAIPFEGPANP